MIGKRSGERIRHRSVEGPEFLETGILNRRIGPPLHRCFFQTRGPFCAGLDGKWRAHGEHAPLLLRCDSLGQPFLNPAEDLPELGKSDRHLGHIFEAGQPQERSPQEKPPQRPADIGELRQARHHGQETTVQLPLLATRQSVFAPDSNSPGSAEHAGEVPPRFVDRPPNLAVLFHDLIPIAGGRELQSAQRRLIGQLALDHGQDDFVPFAWRQGFAGGRIEQPSLTRQPPRKLSVRQGGQQRDHRDGDGFTADETQPESGNGTWRLQRRLTPPSRKQTGKRRWARQSPTSGHVGRPAPAGSRPGD